MMILAASTCPLPTKSQLVGKYDGVLERVFSMEGTKTTLTPDPITVRVQVSDLHDKKISLVQVFESKVVVAKDGTFVIAPHVTSDKVNVTNGYGEFREANGKRFLSVTVSGWASNGDKKIEFMFRFKGEQVDHVNQECGKPEATP